MSEFLPPEEANSPDLVMREEVLCYVEGLSVGDLRFSVFHDEFRIYGAQARIFEFENALETTTGFDRVAHESDKRVAENKYAIALERQADREATVPGYYREQSLLSQQREQWINQYEELTGVDEAEAQNAIIIMMRGAVYKVLERSA
jgi:hypothetical protein